MRGQALTIALLIVLMAFGPGFFFPVPQTSDWDVIIASDFLLRCLGIKTSYTGNLTIVIEPGRRLEECLAFLDGWRGLEFDMSLPDPLTISWANFRLKKSENKVIADFNSSRVRLDILLQDGNLQWLVPPTGTGTSYELKINGNLWTFETEYSKAVWISDVNVYLTFHTNSIEIDGNYVRIEIGLPLESSRPVIDYPVFSCSFPCTLGSVSLNYSEGYVLVDSLPAGRGFVFDVDGNFLQIIDYNESTIVLKDVSVISRNEAGERFIRIFP